MTCLALTRPDPPSASRRGPGRPRAEDDPLRRDRNERIVAAREGGATIAEIADAAGLHRRSIFRILKEARAWSDRPALFVPDEDPDDGRR